jgi:hypothetical protein
MAAIHISLDRRIVCQYGSIFNTPARSPIAVSCCPHYHPHRNQQLLEQMNGFQGRYHDVQPPAK